MRFVAIDVETANPDMSSICQIGIAHFEQGNLVHEWKSYVNPEDWFDPINVSIHGIDEAVVKGAPLLPALAEEICQRLDDQVTVCHTHFDRVAVQLAFEKYRARVPRCTWLDSACVARRTWEQFARGGYGLANICSHIGYEYKAHDALEDAKAAASVLHAAMEITCLDLNGWLLRVRQPINPTSSEPIRREGKSDGAFFGEVVAFTGALTIPRKEAADLAAASGCQVDSGVTKRTTILVVGDQDVTRLAGHAKSSKHRKAEDLIAMGQGIRILRESDFRHLVQPGS
jgi:DNA polymerase-3 subunit epsilon